MLGIAIGSMMLSYYVTEKLTDDLGPASGSAVDRRGLPVRTARSRLPEGAERDLGAAEGQSLLANPALMLEEPWLQKFRENPRLLQAIMTWLGGESPALAMQYADILRASGVARVHDSAMAGWVSVEPEAAWQWKLENEREDATSVRTIKLFVRSGAGPSLARTLLAMPPSGDRQNLAYRLFDEWTTVESGEAKQWLDSLNVDSRSKSAASHGYLTGWASSAGNEAADWVFANTPSGDGRSDAMAAIYNGWRRNATLLEIDEWVTKRPNQEDLSELTLRLSRDYLENSPSRALELATSISPALPERDLLLLTGSISNTIPRPALALKFIEAISSEDLRARGLARFRRSLLPKDLAIMAEAIAKSPRLSEKDKADWAGILAKGD